MWCQFYWILSFQTKTSAGSLVCVLISVTTPKARTSAAATNTLSRSTTPAKPTVSASFVDYHFSSETSLDKVDETESKAKTHITYTYVDLSPIQIALLAQINLQVVLAKQ